MHNTVNITDDLVYLGASDRRIALFESAYPVPRGVSYNSYLLLDEKTVLFDTADLSVSGTFLENLAFALGGRPLDYLVVHHMEPDHSATFERVLAAHPGATVVANDKTVKMLRNYFGFEGKSVIVKEGDALSVGKRTLKFVFAPMVHWPEVMMSYIPEEGVLFTADAFGTFGALGGSIFADELFFERDFLDDARRYYLNIVGKYGVQVQNVLKKAAGLDLSYVCPLHGPVWRKDFGSFLEKYDLWSRYLPEEKGVAVFYASVYGHTQNAAEIVATEIAKRGVYAAVYDVSVTHVSELLAAAFRYSHCVFASTTYNNGVFVSMENFLSDLKAHNFQRRKYALVGSGSWSPQAAARMEDMLAGMTALTPVAEPVTVLSAVDEGTREKLAALAEAVAEDCKN